MEFMSYVIKAGVLQKVFLSIKVPYIVSKALIIAYYAIL